MWRRYIAIFMIFFLGTGALLTVDRVCRQSTGQGGETGLALHRTEDGALAVSFFGLEGELPLP